MTKDVPLKSTNGAHSLGAEESIRLASEPDTPGAVLDKLVGTGEDIDLLLAQHRNLTAAGIEALARSQSESVRKMLVQNPSLRSGLLLRSLIENYPEEFLKNTALDRFLQEDPYLLTGISSVLDLKNCPDNIVTCLAAHGSLEQKIEIFFREIGSNSARTLLTQNYLEKALDKHIEKLIDEQTDPLIKEALKAYCKNSEPYARPVLTPQNRNNLEQRTQDMIGGFPYTSERHPWPICDETGLHMQPIVQINLVNAGNILEFDFGHGLLQLWGRVAKTTEELDKIDIGYKKDYSRGICLRIIDLGDLCDAPSDFFPDFSPWLTDEENCFFTPNKDWIAKPLIQWKRVSRMFQRIHYEWNSFDQLIPHVKSSLTDENFEDDDQKWEDFREIAETSLHTATLGTFPRLGGMWGASGPQDPSVDHKVLFNVFDDSELTFTIIFDEYISVKPTKLTDGNSTIVKFPREKALRALFSYPSYQ